MRLTFRIENDISYDFIYWSEVSLQYKQDAVSEHRNEVLSAGLD